MHNGTAAHRRAGWLTSLIHQARTCGVDNGDIAAALEESMVFRPLMIGRDGRDRLVGMTTDGAVTLTDLFDPPDEDHRA